MQGGKLRKARIEREAISENEKGEWEELRERMGERGGAVLLLL